MVNEGDSRIPERIRENIPKSVAIVGVGGIGSWTAMLFGQIGKVERIGLFDEDIIEESNIERTPYRYTDLGKRKSAVMKKMVIDRSSNTQVISYDHLTEDNELILRMYDLVVVCADNGTIRNRVLENHRNTISAGYDIDEEKDWITLSEQPMWMFDDDEDNDYTIEPSWSGPAILGAFLVVDAVLNGRRPARISAGIEDMYKIVNSNDHREFRIVEQEDDEGEDVVEVEEIQPEEDEEDQEEGEGGLGELFDSATDDTGVRSPWRFNETDTADDETTRETDRLQDESEIEEHIMSQFPFDQIELRHPYSGSTVDDIIEDSLQDIDCPRCGMNALFETEDHRIFVIVVETRQQEMVLKTS